jgi:hypothetical protein
VAKQRKIIVRAKPRKRIDAEVLAQVLLAIAADWGEPRDAGRSPDAFEAAIEDRAGTAPEQAG